MKSLDNRPKWKDFHREAVKRLLSREDQRTLAKVPAAALPAEIQEKRTQLEGNRLLLLLHFSYIGCMICRKNYGVLHQILGTEGCVTQITGSEANKETVQQLSEESSQTEGENQSCGHWINWCERLKRK